MLSIRALMTTWAICITTKKVTGRNAGLFCVKDCCTNTPIPRTNTRTAGTTWKTLKQSACHCNKLNSSKQLKGKLNDATVSDTCQIVYRTRTDSLTAGSKSPEALSPSLNNDRRVNFKIKTTDATEKLTLTPDTEGPLSEPLVRALLVNVCHSLPNLRTES